MARGLLFGVAHMTLLSGAVGELRLTQRTLCRGILAHSRPCVEVLTFGTMPRQPASVVLRNPVKFGRLLADVLRLARPESGVGYSLREAGAKTVLIELGPDDRGLSAPGLKAILDGRRSRISATTLMRLWRLLGAAIASSDQTARRSERGATQRREQLRSLEFAIERLYLVRARARGTGRPRPLLREEREIRSLASSVDSVLRTQSQVAAAHLDLVTAIKRLLESWRDELELPSDAGIDAAERRRTAAKKK